MLVVALTIFLSLTGPVAAQSGGLAETRLLSKSSSGKTVILNIGSLDSVKEGDFGVIMRRLAPQEELKLRVIPVARGRVVKTGKTTSLWYLYEISDSIQLIARDSYIVTTESMTLSGRRLVDSGRLKVISPEEMVESDLNFKQQSDRDLLSKKAERYKAYRSTRQSGERWTRDGVLVDVDEWVSIDAKGERKFAKELWRSPYEKDFAEKKRLETFEKLVATYLQKINDPSFDYGKFYAEQARDETGEFRLSVASQTQYQAFLEEEREKMKHDSRFYRQLMDKGQAWSEDYSDEELAQVIEKIGITYEQERRKTVSTNLYDWLVQANFGFNLLDNENRVDQANTRPAKWSWSIGGEWFFAPRHESMQRFSLIGSFRNARDGISVGNLNAQFDDYSFHGGFQWHPFHSPFVMGQNIFFVSIGLRSGVVRLSTPSNGDAANYGIFSLPSLSTGIKYNLRSGLGVIFTGSIERSYLEKIRNNRPDVDLPQRAEFIDGRINVGLTKLY
jgi:hypothetical protein